MLSSLTFILCISLISASILSRVPLKISTPLLTSASNPISSQNSTNASLQLITPTITYNCEGGYYGHGQHADSCDEALRSMAIVPGSAAQQFTWGRRTLGHYDVPLPQRWVSC